MLVFLEDTNWIVLIFNYWEKKVSDHQVCLKPPKNIFFSSIV